MKKELLAIVLPLQLLFGLDWVTYVTDYYDGTLTPINATTGEAGVSIPVVNGSDLEAIAFSSDGQKAYIAAGSGNAIIPVDVATNSPGRPIFVGENPKAIATNPKNNYVYAVNYGSNNVTVIDPEVTTRPVAIIEVGQSPSGIAVSQDGMLIFVTNFDDNTVTPIDGMTNIAHAPIAVGRGPQGVAIAPDNSRVLVTNSLDNTISEIDLTTSEVFTVTGNFSNPIAVEITPDGNTACVINQGNDTATPIDLTTSPCKPMNSFSVGPNPVSVAFNPIPFTYNDYIEDYYVYIVNQGNGTIATYDLETGVFISSLSFGGNLQSLSIESSGTIGYVTDTLYGTFRPIDIQNNRFSNPVQVGAKPKALVVTPDRKKAYLASESFNTVFPIDLTTAIPTVGNPIAVGPVPTAMALSPDGKKGYVVAGYSQVNIIDLETDTLDPASPIWIPGASFPQCIALTPDGSTAYVSNVDFSHFPALNSVIPIDLTGSVPVVGSPIIVDNFISALSVSPDPSCPEIGYKVYVLIEPQSEMLTIYSASNTVASTISVGSYPNSMAITPDGTAAYIRNGGDNSISKVDLTGDVPAVVSQFGNLAGAGLVISPDGKKAFAVSGKNVNPIDLAVSPPTIGDGIITGSYPISLAITPDQAPIASFFAPQPIIIGVPVTFTDTSSTETGLVTGWSWDFGDGSGATDQNPTHVYDATGTNTVTLTVTNSAGTSTKQTFTGRMVSNNGNGNALISQNVEVTKATPIIREVSTQFGSSSGGTTVVIKGDNLFGTTSVNFGVTAALSYSISLDPSNPGAYQITAISPPGMCVVPITVTTPSGTSVVDSSDYFGYYE